MTTSTSGAHLGAYRNLTDKFIRFRDQARGNYGFATNRQSEAASTRLLEAALGSSSSMGLGQGDEGSGLEGLSATLPPAWVDFSEEVSADVNRIKGKLKELAAAHHKALLPNFDDMGNDKDDHVVEIVTQDITRLFKRCETRLRALNDARGGAHETVIIKNVQRKLATELQKLSQEFRKMQKDYLQRLKQQEGRGPGASGVDDIFGWDAATGGGGGQGLADPGKGLLALHTAGEEAEIKATAGDRHHFRRRAPDSESLGGIEVTFDADHLTDPVSLGYRSRQEAEQE